MPAIVGYFDTRLDAERAAVALTQAGVPPERLSYLGARPDLPESDGPAPAGGEAATVTGIGVGGFAGGALGALVGLGALAIPAIGPIVAAGALGSALAGGAIGAATGMAAGGLAGALVDLGLPRAEADRAHARIEQGGAVLMVECEDAQVGLVRDTLQLYGADHLYDRGEPGAGTSPTLEPGADPPAPSTTQNAATNAAGITRVPD